MRPRHVAVITGLGRCAFSEVLSAPVACGDQKKTASINVGTQLPVVSSFINNGNSNPNDPAVGQSYVQFRQIGITLTVTPRVNPGGLVFMEIEQEESEPGAGDPVGGNIPVDNRSINTEIAVQSGQTVILGGLIKQTENSSRNGAPFLSRIPVLGGLFGRDSHSSSREELLVMITPRVIRNPNEAREITEEYKSRFRGLEPLRVMIEK